MVLVTDAMAAIQDQIEAQVLVGDGQAPNFSGITTGATDAHSAEADAATWAEVVAVIEGLVDGKLAATSDDIRLFTHPITHGWLAGLVHTSGDRTALEYIEERTGGLVVSAHAPARQTPTSSTRFTVVVVSERARSHFRCGIRSR